MMLEMHSWTEKLILSRQLPLATPFAAPPPLLHHHHVSLNKDRTVRGGVHETGDRGRPGREEVYLLLAWILSPWAAVGEEIATVGTKTTPPAQSGTKVPTAAALGSSRHRHHWTLSKEASKNILIGESSQQLACCCCKTACHSPIRWSCLTLCPRGYM
jgi:hypothetical protein